jgi:hypothetical protein
MQPNRTGIYASQISGHLYDGPFGAYDSLASVTLSASTATVTFAGIPSGYKHLQLRAIGHWSGTANTYANGQMQFNGDTGSNYAYHRLYGNGTAASADASTSTTKINTPWFPDDTYTSNFGTIIVDILDYANTNKYKTVKSLGGFDGNGTGLIGLISGLWMNTAAITSLSFSLPAYNLITYSSFALYGVK